MINGIDYYRRYETALGWKIDKLIGEGSSGEVFRVTRKNDDGTESEAALKAICIPKSEMEYKILKNDGFTPETAKAYLENVAANIVKEYSLMAKFNDAENIVCYQDHLAFRHESGVGWDILIRMELLTPVNDYFRSKPLTLHDIINLGIGICKALELCHAQNVIHRDIKPENIFADKNGNFKLGDFGIAREIEKTQAGLTKTGTLTYMAPEIFRGEPYGKTIDIYSLGIVLYKLVNHNRVPFSPRYPEPVTYETRELANSARMRGEKLPYPDGTDFREFSDVILKACSFNPEDRYSSATEMREALEALLKLPSYNVLTASGSVSEYENEISAGDSKSPETPVEVINERKVSVLSKASADKAAAMASASKTAPKAKKGSFLDNKLAVVAAVFIPTIVIIGVIIAVFLLNGGMNPRGIYDPVPVPGSEINESMLEDKAKIYAEGKRTEESGNILEYGNYGSVYYALMENGTVYIGGIEGSTCMMKGGGSSVGEGFLDHASKKKVTKAVVEDSVMKLGTWAFYGCTNLTDAEINCAEIGMNAFNGCMALKNVTVAGVKIVNKDAFMGCTSLEKVEFTEELKTISGCFDGCSELEEIIIPGRDVDFDLRNRDRDIPFFNGCHEKLVVRVHKDIADSIGEKITIDKAFKIEVIKETNK